MVLVLGLAAAVVGWCVIATVLPWSGVEPGTTSANLRGPGRRHHKGVGAPDVSSTFDGGAFGANEGGFGHGHSHSHDSSHGHGHSHDSSHGHGHDSSAPDCGVSADAGWGGDAGGGGGGDCGGGGGGD